MGERYLRSVRLLAECMQSFEKSSAQHIRQLGFTHSQFDIIATLGNTPGMTCKDLGDKTLITKGTLTGVLDRLEQKGLIERERGCDDRRQFFVKLSPRGDEIFRDVFPKVVSKGKQRFRDYADADFDALERALLKLKDSLNRAAE
ncbi:MarR family transcriptional regulator [Undibacterium sp.]|jgi:MarR family 2-MHQ and catechol resistance regulon transcriptional repressor|uniref:MarR family winged helix-turn-helix transcriptional regulator n=1 Tax=Undibacterium sp. TaxID=1914977 RepID=UPI002CFA8AA0|nr:MarR family transcriptional regulator [Undibacterium sp.]HTD05675.1 MarR family transcriptional regulator [Undibacterium sp.]